jgi:colanic acid/amylovoran biosynthesis glycosyltransferase
VNLILFSASFPYVKGNEASFLGIEVQYLRKVFDRIIIVPEDIKDPTPVDHTGLEVDTSYSVALSSANTAKLFQLAFSSSIFYKGLMEAVFPRSSFVAWRRLVSFSGKAEITRRWVLNFLHAKQLEPQDTLFYTYWLYHAATGIAFARQQHPDLRLASRAHGYDIYAEEYYTPPFFPCRETTIPWIDRIFPDSEAGAHYLQNQYPKFSTRIETSLLGVTDPGFLTNSSTDGVFRVISCSMIRPEKRVGLIFDVIKLAAISCPDQRFEWTHVGNGVLRAEFKKRSELEFPPNAKAIFPGYSDNETLMKMYQEIPFDLLINLSETEGTPVSIMEAISCGIPILATAVGGNKEIVSARNGFLVSENPAPDEVASRILSLIDNPEDMNKKRIGSRRIWETRYNAQRNFSEFAQTLRSLRMNNNKLLE